jgi:hypothetical protein
MILSIETAALGAVAYYGRAKNGPAFLLTTKPILAINLQYRAYPAYAFTMANSMAGLQQEV